MLSNPDTSDVVELEAGDAANIPALAFHHAWNVGDETCEILWWVPGEMHTDEFKHAISTREHGEWRWYRRDAVMLNGTHDRNDGLPVAPRRPRRVAAGAEHEGAARHAAPAALALASPAPGNGSAADDPRLVLLLRRADPLRQGDAARGAGVRAGVGAMGEDALRRGRLALGQPDRHRAEPARRARATSCSCRPGPSTASRRSATSSSRRSSPRRRDGAPAGASDAGRGGRARAGGRDLPRAGRARSSSTASTCPVFTDSLLAEHVCLEAARRARTDVLVTPPLWTGFSPHHLRFGATVTLSSATFAALVRETVESLRTWCARVLVVNGHGGNRGPAHHARRRGRGRVDQLLGARARRRGSRALPVRPRLGRARRRVRDVGDARGVPGPRG